MSRSRGLISALVLFSAASIGFAADPATFPEYEVVHSVNGHVGAVAYTYWQSKDLTGALGLWEASRQTGDKSCSAAPFCTVTRAADGPRTVILDDSYVISFAGTPTQAQVDSVLATLPGKKETSLPAILTFVPHTGLVPGSARYILGPASFQAYAPELNAVQPGFEEGAEAQVADYGHAKLALFYYPTPEMARLHSIGFKSLGNVFVKRSGVLVAIVYGNVSQQQADTLLSRVEYEAKITWNEHVPQSPIKPVYELLLNILILSGIIVALCLAGGLMYGGTRIYRRRYGQLESEEAMTTLRLTEHP
jgi:hypothetical protein